MQPMKPFDPCVAERQPVWPAGAMPDRQPHQIAAMTDEAESPGFDPDAHREPFLDWFPPPAEPNGGCAILVSGGAYVNCCDVGLIKEWRERFEALGFQCVNFVYRTPWPKGLPMYKTAWEDARRAVRLVRSQAAARGFDPERIVTVSMSAGSHLSLLLATASQTKVYEPVDALDETPCHTNAAVAFAPAGMLSDGPMCANEREGDGLDIELDPAFAFDAKTPPVCLLHGGADPYSTFNSTRIYRRLRAAGVPAELHIFPDRGHGMFGLERGVEFLRQIGFLGPPEPEVPVLERFASDAARASHETVPLWPEGQMPDPQPDQCEPILEWHLPAKLSTRAIQVIWSGGAYVGNDPDGFEVAPARRYLNEKGMAVATVRYRTPRPSPPLAKHVTAWQDAQRAIRLVRAGAAARGLDPDRIGILGSSAGGHLALLAATGSRHKAYRPVDETDAVSAAVQWCVAIYPAYTIEGTYDNETRDGGSNGPALRLAPELPFDPDTPPTLFLHGDADVHPATASVAVWEQLRRMGIQGAVHTLATRGHCFYFAASPGTGSHTFLDRIWEFLSDKGFI